MTLRDLQRDLGVPETGKWDTATELAYDRAYREGRLTEQQIDVVLALFKRGACKVEFGI